MSIVRIPDKYRKGFELFLALDATIREKLVDNIERAKINSDKPLIEVLVEDLKFVRDDAVEIMGMIESLYNAKETGEMDVNSFIDSIIEALQESDYKVTNDLKDILIKLLATKDNYLYINSKAKNLASERDKLLLETRILTDIRPIFNDEQNCTIIGSIVTHTLKIAYHEGDDIKLHYFALDKKDLEILKEHISRAEQKEISIREKYNNDSIFFEYN